LENPKIYYNSESIQDNYDIVIPRIDVPYTDFGFKVLRQFQALGIYTTDTAYSLELARNKLRSLQYMMRHNVPFPTTGFSYAMGGYKKLMKTIGGDSFVIKLNEGTQGMGVFLAEDRKQAKNFLGTFDQFDTEVMAQEFIAESAGTDLRCFVVGDKVVASMRFSADLSEEERELALKASKAVTMNISGVDIIRSDRGPLVIEINSAPDFGGEWGLESVSGVDVADAIVAYAEEGKARYDRGEGIWLDDPGPYKG